MTFGKANNFNVLQTSIFTHNLSNDVFISNNIINKEGPGEQVEGTKIERGGREVEVGGSVYLSRWTSDPIPEEKGENQVLKERFRSVYGWCMGGWRSGHGG